MPAGNSVVGVGSGNLPIRSRHTQLPDVPRTEFEVSIAGLENSTASSAAWPQAEYWLPQKKHNPK